MFQCFLICHEKGGMEDRVDLPLRRNVEVEGHSRNDFFHFKWTCLFHLEFLGSVHVEVGHFKPHQISNFPGSELG